MICCNFFKGIWIYSINWERNITTIILVSETVSIALLISGCQLNPSWISVKMMTSSFCTIMFMITPILCFEVLAIKSRIRMSRYFYVTISTRNYFFRNIHDYSLKLWFWNPLKTKIVLYLLDSITYMIINNSSFDISISKKPFHRIRSEIWTFRFKAALSSFQISNHL